MHSDSRKAQHNSFAHYRADLLFARRPIADEKALSLGLKRHRAAASLRQLVRASLLGAPQAQPGA